MAYNPKIALGVAVGELIIIALLMLIMWVFVPLFGVEAYDKEGNRLNDKIGHFIRNDAVLKNPTDQNSADGKRKIVVGISIGLLTFYLLSLCVLFFMYLATYKSKGDGAEGFMNTFAKKRDEFFNKLRKPKGSAGPPDSPLSALPSNPETQPILQQTQPFTTNMQRQSFNQNMQQ